MQMPSLAFNWFLCPFAPIVLNDEPTSGITGRWGNFEKRQWAVPRSFESRMIKNKFEIVATRWSFLWHTSDIHLNRHLNPTDGTHRTLGYDFMLCEHIDRRLVSSTNLLIDFVPWSISNGILSTTAQQQVSHHRYRSLSHLDRAEILR